MRVQPCFVVLFCQCLLVWQTIFFLSQFEAISKREIFFMCIFPEQSVECFLNKSLLCSHHTCAPECLKHGCRDVNTLNYQMGRVNRTAFEHTHPRICYPFITNTHLFKYIENFTTKKIENVQIKILIFFFIFLLKT